MPRAGKKKSKPRKPRNKKQVKLQNNRPKSPKLTKNRLSELLACRKPEQKVLLCLDPATSTGLVVLFYTDAELSVRDLSSGLRGYIDLDDLDKKDKRSRWTNLMSYLKIIKPDVIYYEETKYMMKYLDAGSVYSKILGVVETYAYKNLIYCVGITVPAIRKLLCDNGSADKNKVQEALADKAGILEGQYDTSDALAVAYYAIATKDYKKYLECSLI